MVVLLMRRNRHSWGVCFVFLCGMCRPRSNASDGVNRRFCCTDLRYRSSLRRRDGRFSRYSGLFCSPACLTTVLWLENVFTAASSAVPAAGGAPIADPPGLLHVFAGSGIGCIGPAKSVLKSMRTNIPDRAVPSIPPKHMLVVFQRCIAVRDCRCSRLNHRSFD